MCSGDSKRKPYQTSLIKGHEYGKQEGLLHHKISALLEYSATDDVMAFKDAVEKDDHDINDVGLWYGRKVGSKEMCYEERTPLMIAAMFGSKGVLSYILETGRVDVNTACGSDMATPLHCAVAGASAYSPEVVKLLLNASADVTSVDANGNRASDLIFSVSNSIFSSRKRILQAILEGADDDDIDVMKKQQQDDDVVSSTPRPRLKKGYRVDPSLPDINSSLYSTDEFRMYTFKVKLCSRVYAHDWTACPFAHPGESVRRRDPTKYPYSCVPCPHFRKGSCRNGNGCEYAHGIFESWLHPAQYRTQLCKDKTGCNRRVCFFAHNHQELRTCSSSLPSPTASSIDTFTLQKLLISRLKTALIAGDSDLDIGLLGLENLLIRKVLMEDIVAPYQKQSPTEIHVHHNANQQLWGYAPDPSYAAFSKRNESFIEHNVVNYNSELHSPATTQVSVEAFSTISSSGSCDGKLNWANCGDELNKLRKSSSFGFRNRTLAMAATTEVPPNVDEPDVSWVNSLLKDGAPTLESDQYCVEDMLGQNGTNDAVPSWPEQMVA